jgi:hypothetical protein
VPGKLAEAVPVPGSGEVTVVTDPPPGLPSASTTPMLESLSAGNVAIARPPEVNSPTW